MFQPGFNAWMEDGSVGFMRHDTDERVLRSYRMDKLLPRGVR
jgi:hypothetical protein